MELKERLEAEMSELQANIEHLQKMEKMLKKEAQKNGNQDSLKEKLEVEDLHRNVSIYLLLGNCSRESDIEE